MKRIPPSLVWVALAAVGIVLAAPSVAAQERRTATPTLAGIFADPSDPSKSIAIVDGRRLRVGSRWQGLELVEVAGGFVKLRDTASGHELVLSLGTGAVARERGWRMGRPGPSRAERVNPVSVTEEEFLDKLNPARLVWKAYTSMAQATLRQIVTAQEMFAINDLNYDGLDHYARSLQELARHGLVQADLVGGEKFGYRFRVRAWEDKRGPHFECFAEPVRGDTRQPYLYTDESGVIRGQRYARAGYDSRPLR